MAKEMVCSLRHIEQGGRGTKGKGRCLELGDATCWGCVLQWVLFLCLPMGALCLWAVSLLQHLPSLPSFGPWLASRRSHPLLIRVTFLALLSAADTLEITYLPLPLPRSPFPFTICISLPIHPRD